MRRVKEEADRVVTLVARINALRSKLYHDKDKLNPDERKLIEEQIAAFRLRLAGMLYRKDMNN
jgi:capsule polysaccharide export protein KpsE/RkpR